MVHKHWSDLSDFSGSTGEKSSGLTGGTRASVTPEKRIPKRKKSKPLAMSPPRKYPIKNQDKNIIGLKKDQWLTPEVPLFLPGNKSLRNKENDNNPETTDTSHTEKDDMSHTNQDDSIANVKDMKNTNDDEKHKKDTPKHQYGN